MDKVGKNKSSVLAKVKEDVTTLRHIDKDVFVEKKMAKKGLDSRPKCWCVL
jgi:hypothetical protein